MKCDKHASLLKLNLRKVPERGTFIYTLLDQVTKICNRAHSLLVVLIFRIVRPKRKSRKHTTCYSRARGRCALTAYWLPKGSKHKSTQIFHQHIL